MRRQNTILLALFVLGLTIGLPAVRAAEPDVKAEIRLLKEQLAEQRRLFEQRIRELEAKVEALTPSTSATSSTATAPQTEADLAATLDMLRGDSAAATPLPSPDLGSRLGTALQSLNPDVSVIVDTFYHNDDSKEGIQHVFEGLSGFGHSHGDDDHSHQHAHLDDGLNLRHLELHFSAEADPYFRGWAIAAVSEESAEMEEAVIQTSCLPGGLQLQAGKFFSNFGRLNAQHSHEWDFVDQPLIYQLTLGDHGLNDKGVQLSWLAPTPFHLLFGVEAFQGDNELLFQHLGDDELPRREGPRAWVGWVKLGPNLPEPHGLQLGAFAAHGVHQEAHDGDSDGTEDHWLDGYSSFWGADLVYKYDSHREHGHGDVVLQGEYMYRVKDLEVEQHDLNAALVGRDRIDRQDGYYLQALYGFLPRWRAGLRWEQIGLTNESELPPPGTDTEHYGSSWRLAGMVDFSPSEFSRLRLQIGRGSYETDDGDEDVWQVFVQWMISLGTHGAHKF